MRRLTLAAGAFALGIVLSGGLQPAVAAGVASCMDEQVLGADGLYHEKVAVFADTIMMTLRQQGYDVESVEPWGGCVRAFITDPGGGSHMAFFDPDTLQPLSTN
jgi:hypothetical protein